jgi:hypothetical protein
VRPTRPFPNLRSSLRSSNRSDRELRQDTLRLTAWFQQWLQQNHSPGCDSLAVTARITPLDAQGSPGEPCDVDLQQFDSRRLTFAHRLPLADRRAVVSLEAPQLGQLVAEVDLSWCCYREGGGYTSGGRLVLIRGDRLD